MSEILVFSDVLHPVGGVAVQMFDDGDVGHGCGDRGSMPVALTGCEEDHVAGMDLLDRSALPLHSAQAAGHDQVLPQGMAVPGGPGTGLKGHCRGEAPGRSRDLKEWVHADRAAEPGLGAFHGGLGAIPENVHIAVFPFYG